MQSIKHEINNWKQMLTNSRKLAKQRENKLKTTVNAETTRANKAELGPIIAQNETLTTMIKQHEVTYTKQKYVLDQIQRSIFWNKLLWMVYYLMAAIAIIRIVSAATLKGTGTYDIANLVSTHGVSIALIVAAIAFPYVVYPVEQWVWNFVH